MMKTPKQFAGSRIFTVISCSFLTLILTILVRVFSAMIKYIREVSYGIGVRTWQEPGFTITQKTQKSGRQEINIRHLPIALENKKEQRKIAINSR